MIPAPVSSPSRDIVPEELFATERLAGPRLLLLLDVDGTLAPIAPHPALARIPDETRRSIASLAANPNVVVVLVSGRAAHDARRLVGVEGVWTIGNHGAEVMDPDGMVVVDESVARYADSIAQTANVLDGVLAPLKGVVLENKTWTLSVHFRVADEAIVPALRMMVERIAGERGLRVTEGKKVLEIRPPVRVDKGTAIAQLMQTLGASGDDTSILFAGDDLTDEDAFRLLRSRFPNAVTVHVGGALETSAEFRFETLDQVRVLLARMAHPASSR